ncbi:hypothetical protein C1H46_041298 [Malus baccata]|uniref:Prefoldin subunit 3 n=1 Tax=Malus baccata TaxID=106549 RepID=A0A540KG67_MALBA|nr:hypothetical protein C1H46_041298 [Malus baccata]
MATESPSSSSAAVTERRGIPGAQFVEDVQTYLTQLDLDVNSALAFLQERLQNTVALCLVIAITIGIVEVELITDFEVSEGIYSRASIDDTESVCLWLGANVMLEYSCEEATALLRKNLDNARASLEVLLADLQFLRDQVTITQVTIARVYNWDVHQRRLRQSSPKDS